MIAPSTRPYGVAVRPGLPIKLKGAVLLQAPAQWPYWAQFWRDWDWTTIARTIDNLATLGVNCLQFTATGLDDGGVTHPSDTTMAARIGQLAAYAALKGMTLNPQFGYQPQHTFATSPAVGTAAAVRMARLFAQVPNVAFIDAMNEVDGWAAPGWTQGSPNGQSASDLAAFNAGIRAVSGTIPVTFSVGCSAISTITGAWMQAVAGLCDFHNVHTYYYAAGATTVQASDFTALRAAPWYLGRFIMGETGVPSQNGTTLQTNWLAGNGAVAAAADCLGSICWGATDTSSAAGQSANVSNFGVLDATGTTLRTALSAPIAAWPGVL